MIILIMFIYAHKHTQIYIYVFNLHVYRERQTNTLELTICLLMNCTSNNFNHHPTLKKFWHYITRSEVSRDIMSFPTLKILSLLI